jgi:ligand-binding SRPBCC domain-containing protein
MKVHVLERSQVVARPRSDVFAFFADARNLEAITPAFLHFEILPPIPQVIRPGTLIDYRLSLFGVPFRWRTRIEAVEPEARFVDVQVRGPYRLWHHSHSFEDVPGGTRVGDRVRYALPLGLLGEAAHPIFVKRTLDRIFDHRRDRIAEILGASPRAA